MNVDSAEDFLHLSQQCQYLQAYQLMPSGVTKLPPFQIAATTPTVGMNPPAMPRLNTRDVHLMTLYGRVYCAYLDVQAGRLLLYRFYS